MSSYFGDTTLVSTEQFIQERRYLKAASEATITWYRNSFRVFEGALDSTATINARIIELRNRGVKPVSINTWLRCIKAYYLWQGKKWASKHTEFNPTLDTVV